MKVCIFCGRGGNLTNEHIFPKWLQDYLGVNKTELKIYQTPSLELRRQFAYQNHLNGLVCRECNNGWMSELEAQIKPIILSLIEDATPRDISLEDSSALTWWIFKTILALHSVSPDEKIIPPDHYLLAYKKTIPGHLRIAIAQLAQPLDAPSWIQNQNWFGASQYYSEEELKENLRKTYRITIGFSTFAARVHYFPLYMPLFPLESGVQFIDRRPTPVAWPPSETIQDLYELDRGLIVPRRIMPISNDIFIDGN